ncbi:MAG: CooT family nickel-binding protein [Clostridia bacterium]|nr:CooT family nickel-binding protein [Clostridia bacterium]
MCLSTVYAREPGDRVLMENVKTIECDKEYVTLTDLMERSLRVRGLLCRADLVGGVVVIECHE